MPALDDRGNPITVLKPAEIRRAGDSADPARAHLVTHLRQAIRAESRRFSLFHLGWSIAAVMLWFFVQFAVSLAGLFRYPGVRPLVFFGGIIALVFIGRELTRRRVSRLVAATAVAEGICGQCCYSLESVPADPDGCMTCPECGAAWLTDRVTRPFWLSPQLPKTFHDDSVPFAQRIPRLLFRFVTATPKPSTLIAADDRGRFVRTVDSRMFLIPPVRKIELGVDRVAKARKAARRRGRIPRAIVSLPSLALCLLMLWVIARLNRSDNDLLVVYLILGVIALAVTIAINLSHAFIPPSHTARVLVADSICGSCLASISDLQPDPDGCATCPNCGAAWRTTPQTST